MPHILSVRGKKPVIGKNSYIADTAVLIGDVVLGESCSVWHHVVIRGDVHYIRIGDRVNIQDGTIIHGTYQKHPVHIGYDVSIGHRALIHGCTIHDEVLIGMGAILMDGVTVHSEVLVAAGTVVPPGTALQSGWIYAGNPAKPLKPLTQEQLEFYIRRTARNYVEYAQWYMPKK